MYRIDVGIKGLAPYSQNAFTDEAQKKMQSGKTGGKRTVDQAIAEAKTKAYSNGNGIFIPARQIKASLLQGASLANLKEGKRGAWQYINATVFIDPLEIDLGKGKPDFIYERPGRIPPKTGAAAIIRTPSINAGWEASFGLVVTDDNRDPQLLREAMDAAGLLAGVGNNRPEFGRFMVTKWEVNRNGKQ